MKKLVVLLFFCLQVFGQENTANDSLVKTNPVLFAEIFGSIGGSSVGLSSLWGVAMNYQFNEKDVLTFRYSGIYLGKLGGTSIGYTGFPTFETPEYINEFAFLYGKRWIYSQSSLSISGGLSFSNRSYYKYFELENDSGIKEYRENFEDHYLGVPFELSLKWFKAKKSRFRAYYGIIPIGQKKVAFGRSVGLKLTGNFGKSSYFGIGISYGFGLHKRY